jgi:DNA-binding IclR family transcriptional regulator
MASGEMQSLTRATAILDAFTVENPQLGVREIARKINMSVSTVGRLLASLNTLGLLSQDPSSRLYRLGPKVMAYNMVYTVSLDIRASARPMLEELFRLTNETVSLYVLAGDKRICADCIESSEPLRVVVRAGEHMPLHAGSSGKALLAFMSKEDVERVLSKPLEKMTSRTITEKEKILKDLENIREQGYATSHGERFEEVIGVAAPVFDSTGKVVAAINIAGPSLRFTDQSVVKYCSAIVDSADRLSRLLGYVDAAKPAKSAGGTFASGRKEKNDGNKTA